MTLRVNGRSYTVAADVVDPDEPLLWVLRDALGLVGTKYGCGAGICGACTVHLDGQPVRSCQIPLSSAEGREVRTVEGLAAGDALHPVQRAFIDEQVPQCGWCMNGQMMSAVALLERDPAPDRAAIDAALAGNYCRCGCYVRIRAAVARAAEAAAGGAVDGGPTGGGPTDGGEAAR